MIGSFLQIYFVSVLIIGYRMIRWHNTKYAKPPEPVYCSRHHALRHFDAFPGKVPVLLMPSGAIIQITTFISQQIFFKKFKDLFFISSEMRFFLFSEMRFAISSALFLSSGVIAFCFYWFVRGRNPFRTHGIFSPRSGLCNELADYSPKAVVISSFLLLLKIHPGPQESLALNRPPISFNLSFTAFVSPITATAFSE